MSETNSVDGPHWPFTLAVYGEPGVSQACLLLQDRYRADVNVLLLAAFAAGQGHHVGAAEIGLIDEAVHRWRGEVVEPLRVIRRALKESLAAMARHVEAAAFRERLKALELAAEQFEQALIADVLAGWPVPRGESSVASALAGAAAYFRGAHQPADAEVEAALATIAAAAARHVSRPI